VYFPDVEKAEWLNKIMQQMWPYITNYVKTVIYEKVQGSVQSSSTLLSNFNFTEINLGCTAPRVAGLKVYDNSLTRRNEIVMDIQIVYDSECNCGVSVNRLQAGISNFSVRGLLRVEFHPLIEQMPLVGAVSLSFVNDPCIDFNLTELANLFDLPGFNHLLRGAISDGVCGMMVLPDKYVIKLHPDVDISRIRFPLPQGVIRIHVIEARKLEEKDKKILGFGGGSDPYVTVKVGQQHKFTTSIIKNNVNPRWNEVFDALVHDVPTTQIQFALFDDDGALNKSDNLGMVSIPVKSVFELGIIDEWVQLSDASTGAIHIRLEFYELSEDPADLIEVLEHSNSDEKIYSSLLNIYIDGAQNLPVNYLQLYWQSFFTWYVNLLYSAGTYLGLVNLEHEESCSLNILSQNVMSEKTASHTCNPVWEESFNCLVSNPNLDNVSFKISNQHGTKQNTLGHLKFSLGQLLKAKEMTIEQPFALKSSGPTSVLNARFCLRILKLKSQSKSPDKSSFLLESLSSAVENENPENSIEAESLEGSDVGSSLSRSSASANFGLFLALKKNASNGTNSVLGLNTTSSSGRTPSVASEISNIGEISNLRRRLHAKSPNQPNDVMTDNDLGRLKLTIRYSKKRLVVLVLMAENLIACDEDTSDPYVRIYIIPDKRTRKKTKVVKRDLSPSVGSKFDIPKKEVKQKKLHVSVKNQTGFLSSEKVLMGQVIIDLTELDLLQPNTEWY
uniref:Extended synaptotagmin-2 n=2 Tax=Ciona savignyi TaxID=51511 RepID=H2ZR67_CIOSA